MRSDLPLAGSRAFSSSSARARWSARLLSSSVMVLASARRWRGPVPFEQLVQQGFVGGEHVGWRRRLPSCGQTRQTRDALICSSTSFALTGIGVPGPKMPFTPAWYRNS